MSGFYKDDSFADQLEVGYILKTQRLFLRLAHIPINCPTKLISQLIGSIRTIHYVLT